MRKFEERQIGLVSVIGSSEAALAATIALDGLEFPSQKAKDPVGTVSADKEAEAGADGLEEDRSLCS